MAAAAGVFPKRIDRCRATSDPKTLSPFPFVARNYVVVAPTFAAAPKIAAASFPFSRCRVLRRASAEEAPSEIDYRWIFSGILNEAERDERPSVFLLGRV